MTPDRRKAALRVNAHIDVDCADIDEILDAEREARARLPEEFSDTDQARAMDKAIRSLEAAKASLSEAQSFVTDAVEA